MKILLTGAQGQVGREVVEQATPPVQVLAFSKAELDITHPQQVQAVVEAHRPDLVINTAAYTAVDKAETDQAQAFAVNGEGVKNIALVCKAYDLPLIHLSTDYVFDGKKENAYVEDDQHSPLNVYGASKAAGEKVLQETWEKHIILRVSWVFGQYGHNFVKTMLRLASERKELRIVADQRGFPTAAKDLASVLLVLAARVLEEHPQWGVFHYRGDKPVSWFDFANVILKGRDITVYPITTEEFPTPAERPRNSLLDMQKIQNKYGIFPADWEKRVIEIVQSELRP